MPATSRGHARHSFPARQERAHAAARAPALGDPAESARLRTAAYETTSRVRRSSTATMLTPRTAASRPRPPQRSGRMAGCWLRSVAHVSSTALFPPLGRTRRPRLGPLPLEDHRVGCQRAPVACSRVSGTGRMNHDSASSSTGALFHDTDAGTPPLFAGPFSHRAPDQARRKRDDRRGPLCDIRQLEGKAPRGVGIGRRNRS